MFGLVSQRKYDELNHWYELLAEEMNEKNESLKLAQESVASLEEEKKRLTESHNWLTSENQRLTELVGNLRVGIDKMEADLTKASQLLAEKANKYDAIEAIIADKDATIADLTEKVNSQASALKSVRAQLGATRKKLAKYTDGE